MAQYPYPIHPQQPIELRAHLKAISTKPIYFIHRITSSDLELQSTQRKPFSIAWFGLPFIGSSTKTAYMITLKSHPARNMSIQPLSSEGQSYTDLHDALIRHKAIKRIHQDTHLTEVPQWFHCTSCRKWRIHLVPKHRFPVVYAPPDWTCDMGPPPLNTCSRPQSNPTPFQYSEVQLGTLKMQRTLMQQESVVKKPRDVTQWLDKAHMILDRIYRTFDSQYAIIHPFIYSQSRICIHQLKHQLEQNQIQSLNQFALQLRKMFDQASLHTSIRSNAMLVYAQCCRIMREFALSSDIMNMFPAPHTTHPHEDTPLIVSSREYKPKNKENMPVLEKPASVIEIRSDTEEAVDESTHNTSTNTRDTAMANVQDTNTTNTMETDNTVPHDNAKTSDTETDNTVPHDTSASNDDHKAADDEDIIMQDGKTTVLPPLSLQIAVKPASIEAEDTFECVQAFPVIVDKIKMIINQIKVFDEEQHFFKHVQKPGYNDAIANPIHFGEILDKMDANEYDIIAHILADIRLIWSNCYAFNGNPDRSEPELRGFSNYASELEWAMDEYWKQLEGIVKQSGYVDDDKIQRICTKLGLGPVSTHRLYYFKTRLEVYQCIERLFETYNTATFTGFMSTKKSGFCREMKNGMNVDGNVYTIETLRRTIVARFKQLKHALYGTSAIQSPVKSVTVNRSESVSSHESGDSVSAPLSLIRKSVSKRNCIMDSDSDSNRISSQEMKPAVPKTLYVMDKDGLRIRDGLECVFCDGTLQFIPNGIHNHCFARNNFMRCDGCKLILSNKMNAAYYHCLDGCLAHGTSKAHQYYLCTACATRHCNSPQKYVSSHSCELAFNGVWIYLADDKRKSCDIMVMLQDSNRISWKYKREKVYENEEVFHGHIEEMNDSA
eukprot:1113373_1